MLSKGSDGVEGSDEDLAQQNVCFPITQLFTPSKGATISGRKGENGLTRQVGEKRKN